jgi:hypothetical protein
MMEYVISGVCGKAKSAQSSRPVNGFSGNTYGK